jgi:hypothetical protein
MAGGGGLAILTLSSRNVHINNPGAIVNIPLVNLREMWLNGLTLTNTLPDRGIAIGG